MDTSDFPTVLSPADGGAIAGKVGFIFLIVSLRSVCNIGRGIDAFMNKLNKLIPHTPVGRESPPAPEGLLKRPPGTPACSRLSGEAGAGADDVGGRPVQPSSASEAAAS